MKKSGFKVERSTGDDILDEMSLRINQKLKTEKKIDDQKSNVYFWLFKFCFLLLCLVFINFILKIIDDVGVNLIYFFAISLRGILSSIYSFGVKFVAVLLNLYIIYKNLKIFMSSSYYKRLYKNDSEMLSKKKKFFGTIEEVLKALSIFCLFVIALFGIILIALVTLLLTLMTKDMFIPSLLCVFVVGFILCAFVFAEVQKKFLNIPTSIGKKHLYICLCIFLVSLVWFGIDISYDSNPYKTSYDLPEKFETIKKSDTFNTEEVKRIFIKSDAKFDNVEVFVDNTLDDEIRIDTEFYKTAVVSYSKTLNDKDYLLLEFNSDINFKPSNMVDLFELGIETIRTETIYNYNLFKYPKIKVYVNGNDESKLFFVKYNKDINTYIN